MPSFRPFGFNGPDGSLGQLSDLIGVEAVEWPINEYPKQYVRFSIWRTTSAEWWQRTPCLDAIYIDGGHDYATVAIDLEGALRAIRKQARNVSGWILGHDYCEGGVMSGVRRAVDEFCEEHRLELWALTDEPLAAVHRVSEADKLRPEEVAYNSFAIEVRR